MLLYQIVLVTVVLLKEASTDSPRTAYCQINPGYNFVPSVVASGFKSNTMQTGSSFTINDCVHIFLATNSCMTAVANKDTNTCKFFKEAATTVSSSIVANTNLTAIIIEKGSNEIRPVLKAGFHFCYSNTMKLKSRADIVLSKMINTVDGYHDSFENALPRASYRATALTLRLYIFDHALLFSVSEKK
jgi:hypothetical protein